MPRRKKPVEEPQYDFSPTKESLDRARRFIEEKFKNEDSELIYRQYCEVALKHVIRRPPRGNHCVRSG